MSVDVVSTLDVKNITGWVDLYKGDIDIVNLWLGIIHEYLHSGTSKE